MRIKIGSDFSGVGALEAALKKLGVNHEVMFACDNDKYARGTYVLNWGEPPLYPEDVKDRPIPEESLDLFVTSPPCQGYSLSGKRKGSILFLHSHEFIVKNRPRYFIIENVPGLRSHEGGKTFTTWLDMFGGKSVNNKVVMFPHEENAGYHIHWEILNSKNYNVPQNRDRIFIIGIRDDKDNDFMFPKKIKRTKTLRDVLEKDVPEKYNLSDKIIAGFIQHMKNSKERKRGFKFQPIEDTETEIASSILSSAYKLHPEDNYIQSIIGYTRDEKGEVVSRREQDIANTIHTSTGSGGNTDQFVLVKSNTKSGFEEAAPGDSINYKYTNSKTRRGMVGKQVSQAIETQCKIAVVEEINNKEGLTLFGSSQDQKLFPLNGCSQTISAGHFNQPKILVQNKIRRLTPREVFRLMGFEDSFRLECSDTQAYKQGGNSVVVDVYAAIISQLKFD